MAEWAADWREAWEAAAGVVPDQRQRLAYLEQATSQVYGLLNCDNYWAALAAVTEELLKISKSYTSPPIVCRARRMGECVKTVRIKRGPQMTDTQVRNQIRERFAQIARSPRTERVFSVGPTSAKNLGYDVDEIDALPAEVTESFSGVGNPLALRELAAGQTVLDLGCGAGLDSILAGRRVGPAGKVIAVDMTEAMLDKARRNAAALGISNIEWHLADAENLPVADGTVDVMITNGVLNLCQDKLKVLSELHRVLRPGGRLQLADILLHEDVTAENVAKLGTWSD